MTNLYESVYKQLEKEVLELSYSIFFDDMQLECLRDDESNYIKYPPYSLKVGDLLIRCGTEIEALIQALTKGKDKKIEEMASCDRAKSITVGCRLKYLNNVLRLDRKVVLVSCASMFFQKEDNRAFIPFSYSKGDDDDYYSAYNAIKHNRNPQTICKGNIRFLLHALAALYLLNIYYTDEVVALGNNRSAIFVPLNSDVFSIKTFRATNTNSNDSVRISLKDFSDVLSSVFIVKETQKSHATNQEIFAEQSRLVNEKIAELSQTKQFDNQNDIMMTALRLVPRDRINTVFQNIEYEAIVVKPEKVDFYKSEGCVSLYTEEQLLEIQGEIAAWKDGCK